MKMKKENYLNFAAFRKALYDAQLSERARLVYIHLLQKSSIKGCNPNALYNVVELAKPQIAIDLGILTKKGEPANKSIQRALEELEALGYLKRLQKYKSEGCPLTIILNFKKEFLNKKIESEDKNEFNFDKIEDKKESDFVKTDDKFVHPYNPSLSINNPSLSINNPSLSINNNILENNNNNILKESNNNKLKENNKKLEKEFEKPIEEDKGYSEEEFESFKAEADSSLERCINENELSSVRSKLNSKNETEYSLNKPRLRNRLSSYIQSKFEKCYESLQQQCAVASSNNNYDDELPF